MDLSKLRRTSDTFELIQIVLVFFSKKKKRKKKEVVLVWSNLDLNLLSSNQTQSCSQDTPKKKKRFIQKKKKTPKIKRKN